LTHGNSHQERALQALQELGIPDSFLTQYERPVYGDCEDLVPVGQDMFGREQRLERRTAAKWEAMRNAAEKEGVKLLMVSAFRSFDYQRGIMERKLKTGHAVEEIIRVSMPPGFSQHHTGRAIDIGTPDSTPLEEEFENTSAFAWLTLRGREFGFSMTYPRENPLGVIYEPWHWFHGE
jgi:D-alanyl-D-alanine carboxypeptidase